MSDPEFRRFAGVSRTEAYELRRDRRIPFIRDGRRVKYPIRAVKKYLADRIVVPVA